MENNVDGELAGLLSLLVPSASGRRMIVVSLK